MNIQDIEENIEKLIKNLDEEIFLYEFLLSFGISKVSVSRLKKGDFNVSKEIGEVLWKKKIFFKSCKEENLLTLIDDLKKEERVLKHKPKFIIVTDFKNLLALDLKVGDTLDIPISKLSKRFEFFLPLIGMEKTKIQTESIADIKAAEKLGKLYEVLVEENHPKNDEERHAMNVFLSRLLFCFFAEDTNIFPENLFTNSIASHTKPDGSDLSTYLEELFNVLNLDDKKRKKIPGYLKEFPYVNGGLFENKLKVPSFNSKSHKIIVECGSLNWALINPDIFGSMIQAVANSKTRSDLGMHYTSPSNIMKVIEPLFLNDLREQLEKAGDNEKKLKALLTRIYNLRIFDPACGSGNFLIIAYKELCKLEIEIFKIRNDSKKLQANLLIRSEIKTSQFYGIELDDFASETAKLSLWLAEHQMNTFFEEVFGETKPTLPLTGGGNIVCGNSLTEDWNKVCPTRKDGELYIFGNPPYLGANLQSVEQKKELSSIFEGSKGHKCLDYITCWFLKASTFIKSKSAEFAFVSTNSICQGEQVDALWPHISKCGVEISFAYESFKWTNNARRNAGVTCIIIGIRNVSNLKKFIYSENSRRPVKNINYYLSNARNISITKKSKPLSNLPPMLRGSGAVDGGYLLLSELDKNELVTNSPESQKFIKPLVGAYEFLNGKKKYCLWIEDSQVGKARAIKDIEIRIKKVKQSRLESKKKATQDRSKVPHQFGEIRYSCKSAIFVPSVSSERRVYVPFGFVGKDEVIVAPNMGVYGAPIYLFGILSSRMHMVWLRAVGGRLETRIRYSSALCYNTFPLPFISDEKKKELENSSLGILDQREMHSDLTISELYDPEKMPPKLMEAHISIDRKVESCYRTQPFSSDEERLEYLFKLYEEMIEKEKDALNA